MATSSITTRIGRSYFAIFLFNQAAASGDFSTATILTFKPFKVASDAIAMLIAPDPAPNSITLFACSLSAAEVKCPITRSTINSVSGRGIKTPSPTSSSRYRKAALPVMYWTGLPINLCFIRSLNSAEIFSRSTSFNSINWLCICFLDTPKR